VYSQKMHLSALGVNLSLSPTLAAKHKHPMVLKEA